MNSVFKFAAAGVAVFVAAVFITQKTVSSAVETVANVNEGTPFEGTGVVGTLGNITDKASGGLLSRFGSFIGGKIADLRGF